MNIEEQAAEQRKIREVAGHIAAYAGSQTISIGWNALLVATQAFALSAIDELPPFVREQGTEGLTSDLRKLISEIENYRMSVESSPSPSSDEPRPSASQETQD